MNLISVSGKTELWELLNRKISRGIPLEEAAVQLGIPIDEVFTYISGKLSEIDTLDFELRLVGQRAIKNALTKLTSLAKGDAREGKDFESTDLEAAKALAKLGVDALKMARTSKAKKTGSDGQPDLFDSSQDQWQLKKIE